MNVIKGDEAFGCISDSGLSGYSWINTVFLRRVTNNVRSKESFSELGPTIEVNRL